MIMGTVGHPIRHSLSPMIHNSLFVRYKLNIVYLAFDIKEGQTENYVQAMKTLSIIGCNVTMPHKENIMPFMDYVDPSAKKCGSINVVKNNGNQLEGYNVDAGGLLIALRSQGVDYSGRRILLIGAGGAARSILESAIDNGAERVVVLNRTVERAKEICKGRDICTFDHFNLETAGKFAKESDLIINCTSLGMSGTDSDFSDCTFLDKTDAAVADVVYYPPETKIIKAAKERGLKTIDGIQMLIHQALLTFEIVTGTKTNAQRDYHYLEDLLLNNLMNDKK